MIKVFSLWKGEMLITGSLGSMADIAADVAERHGLSVGELKSHLKQRRFAWPRQEAMWLMSRVLRADGAVRYSLPQIGNFLGGRDHTTVIYGIRAHAVRNQLPVPSRLTPGKRLDAVMQEAA